MNDPTKTKDDLDSLADLFLTGTIPGRDKGAAATTAAAGTQPGKGPGVAMNPSRPVRLGPKLIKPRVTSPTSDQPWYSWVDHRVPPKVKDAAVSPARPTLQAGRDFGLKQQSAAAGQPGTDQQDRLSTQAHLKDGVLGSVGGSISPIKQQARSYRRAVKADTGIRVETVVLGSLPVFADPWLAQYGHYLALRNGPVAVLHVAQERVGLEVIMSNNGELTGGLGRPSVAGEAIDFGAVLRDQLSEVDSPIQMIDRLMSLGTNRIGSILVHLEGATTDQMIAAVGRVGPWTILCGAYESAIADACRLIQRSLGADRAWPTSQQADSFSAHLAATNPAPNGFDSTDTPTQANERQPVGIMIMGADETQGRAAIDRLRGALADLRIDIPVEFVGSRKQMAAVNRLELADFPAAQGGLQELMGYLEELPRHNTTSAADAAGATPSSIGVTKRVPQKIGLAADDAGDRGRNEEAVDLSNVGLPRRPLAQVGGGQSDADEFSRDATDIHDAKKSSGVEAGGVTEDKPAELESNAAERSEDLDLSTLLHQSLAGGVALQARCPHKPGTQLVLDEAGRVHLLHRHVTASQAPRTRSRSDQATSGASSEADLRSALVDLIETRSWVQEHLDLLQMTQRQCRFDDQSVPELHLFTDDAKRAAAMATKLGEMLRVHLLQEVRIGSASQWVCTDLN